MEDRIHEALYRTTKDIAEISKNLAVLASEREHISKEVASVCSDIKDLKTIVSGHEKKIDAMLTKDNSKEGTKTMFKENWYKAAMLIIVVGGILTANYELIKQPSEKHLSMKIQSSSQPQQQKRQ